MAAPHATQPPVIAVPAAPTVAPIAPPLSTFCSVELMPEQPVRRRPQATTATAILLIENSTSVPTAAETSYLVHRSAAPFPAMPSADGRSECISQLPQTLGEVCFFPTGGTGSGPKPRRLDLPVHVFVEEHRVGGSPRSVHGA